AQFVRTDAASPRRTVDIRRRHTCEPIFAHGTRDDGCADALHGTILILCIPGDKWISRGYRAASVMRPSVAGAISPRTAIASRRSWATCGALAPPMMTAARAKAVKPSP